ncbi:MAG: mechanosensitive ion channel [Armatimonadota bacterium]|nr:mechanosensitive ion channel [Armatimonadota bacterium]
MPTWMYAFLERTFGRIVTIAVILVGVKFLLDAVEFSVRTVLSLDARLPRPVLQSRKRTRTLLHLVVSMIRYILYFLALGLILRELHVPIGAYLAGVSLIGLAVAFGAQGLVQDLVSGLFILLENQFSVGDMVEVAGKIGLVEDMGLRYVLLRDFSGEVLYIPNRSIVMAGRYLLGSAQAWVDLPLPDPMELPALEGASKQVATTLQTLYPEAFRGMRIEGVRELPDGTRIWRATVWFWPGQSWVVEREFVPRLIRLITERGGAIPADRLAVTYYGGQTSGV